MKVARHRVRVGKWLYDMLSITQRYMYVSIRRYKTGADQVDAVMRRVEEEFLPLVSKVPGFVKYYGVDGGDGMLAFINLFQDEDGAEESNRLASVWVKENLPTLYPQPQDIAVGKMMIDG